MANTTHLVTLTQEQCLELVGTAVAEQLKPLMDALRQGAARQQAPEYFTTKQALEYLHLTKPTLNKLRREGLVSSIQCSDNRVLYHREQLDAYLQSKMQKGGPRA
ncbi:hypothetical protein GCM10022408_10150 [Hymenobacter fastidiosus]|uniref:Helix-turn-helix domain-containing protein n=1 Tax=Hymenobacter fastidiosus TaxID=486264 RepID=A0ABP7RR36_9BACT